MMEVLCKSHYSNSNLQWDKISLLLQIILGLVKFKKVKSCFGLPSICKNLILLSLFVASGSKRGLWSHIFTVVVDH